MRRLIISAIVISAIYAVRMEALAESQTRARTAAEIQAESEFFMDLLGGVGDMIKSSTKKLKKFANKHLGSLNKYVKKGADYLGK